MTKITITELCHRYPGQTEPQPARLVIDPQEQTAYAEYNPESGNGVSMAIWHGRELTCCLSPYVDEGQLTDYLEGDAQRLLEAICDGHTVDWDGNNHVGRLTDEAAEALDALEQRLGRLPDSEYCEADDWLQDLDIPAELESHAGDVDALVSALISECEDAKVRLIGGCEAVADYVRGRMAVAEAEVE